MKELCPLGGFEVVLVVFHIVPLVDKRERRNLCICHIDLLCMVLQMLLMEAFVHMENR